MEEKDPGGQVYKREGGENEEQSEQQVEEEELVQVDPASKVFHFCNKELLGVPKGAQAGPTPEPVPTGFIVRIQNENSFYYFLILEKLKIDELF